MAAMTSGAAADKRGKQPMKTGRESVRRVFVRARVCRSRKRWARGPGMGFVSCAGEVESVVVVGWGTAPLVSPFEVAAVGEASGASSISVSAATGSLDELAIG